MIMLICSHLYRYYRVAQWDEIPTFLSVSDIFCLIEAAPLHNAEMYGAVSEALQIEHFPFPPGLWRGCEETL